MAVVHYDGKVDIEQLLSPWEDVLVGEDYERLSRGFKASYAKWWIERPDQGSGNTP